MKNKLEINLEKGLLNEQDVIRKTGSMGLLSVAQIAKLCFAGCKNPSAQASKVVARMVKKDLLIKKEPANGLTHAVFGLSKLGAEIANSEMKEGQKWFHHAHDLTPSNQNGWKEKLVEYAALVTQTEGWGVLGEAAIRGMKLEEYKRFKAVVFRQRDGFAIGLIAYASSLEDTIEKAREVVEKVNEVRIICSDFVLPHLEKRIKYAEENEGLVKAKIKALKVKK
jgi:hypothetical protein